MTCAGDPTEICGGPKRLSAFVNTAVVSSTSVSSSTSTSASSSSASTSTSTSTSTTTTATKLSIPGFTYVGCMVDTLKPRSLPVKPPNINSTTLTNEICTAA